MGLSYAPLLVIFFSLNHLHYIYIKSCIKNMRFLPLALFTMMSSHLVANNLLCHVYIHIVPFFLPSVHWHRLLLYFFLQRAGNAGSWKTQWEGTYLHTRLTIKDYGVSTRRRFSGWITKLRFERPRLNFLPMELTLLSSAESENDAAQSLLCEGRHWASTACS